MSVIKVEILVKAQQPANERGTQQYDIITIQPANHPWGKGDLRGRFLFCMELDVPCGINFILGTRCSQCEYKGQTTCSVQKYQLPDLDNRKKRKYCLDYSSILSLSTITEVENESAALSIETVDSRLLAARKKNNIVSESVITEKT